MALQHLTIHQILDDFLGCPFRNSDPLRHFPQHRIRITTETDQHMGMVVQKGPLLGDRLGIGIIVYSNIHRHHIPPQARDAKRPACRT